MTPHVERMRALVGKALREGRDPTLADAAAELGITVAEARRAMIAAAEIEIHGVELGRMDASRVRLQDDVRARVARLNAEYRAGSPLEDVREACRAVRRAARWGRRERGR